jgi:hypothetical protein
MTSMEEDAGVSKPKTDICLGFFPQPVTLPAYATSTGQVKRFSRGSQASQCFFSADWRTRLFRKCCHRAVYFIRPHSLLDLSWLGVAITLTVSSSPSHMTHLFSVCRSPQKFWRPVPNGGHNDSVAEPGYFDYIHSFVMEEVLDD